MQPYPQQPYPGTLGGGRELTLVNSYMRRVYNWMASGLALTGIVAYVIANTALSQAFYTVGRTQSGYLTTQPTLLGWAAILAPLAFVLVLSFGVNRMQKTTVQALFWAFAAAMGASMANLFVIYAGTSIATTFFVTAAAFAGLSLFGYTTKRDLSAIGTFLIMALIGLIIASVVNMFLNSSMLYWIITYAGVLIFSGLIAFDTQRLKLTYYELGGDQAAMSVATSYGALSLFINFVNLFLFLLRIFGGRD